MFRLETIPDVIEPYTERILSYVDFDPTTNTVTVHNTPSNFEIIEKIPSLSPQKAGEEETSEVSELLDVGVKLYVDGYYRDALDRFNRALALDPENKIARKYTREITEYLTPGVYPDKVEVVYPD